MKVEKRINPEKKFNDRILTIESSNELQLILKALRGSLATIYENCQNTKNPTVDLLQTIIGDLTE